MPPSLTSSTTNLGPTTKPTTRQVAIAAIGMSTELAMKSKKSRKDIPRGCSMDRGP